MIRSSRCIVALVLLLAAVAPEAAVAQSAAADPRLARLEPGLRNAIIAIIDTARSERIPTEPLVDKALEGASKGAPQPRVIAAVRTLAARLGVARTALGTSSADVLVAGADALRAGASQVTLVALRERRPADQLGVPLAVLADLVARGVDRETASRTILALAQQGATDDEYIALRRAVERDVHGGIPPAASIAARGNAVIVAGPPRPPGGSVGAAAGPTDVNGLARNKP